MKRAAIVWLVFGLSCAHPSLRFDAVAAHPNPARCAAAADRICLCGKTESTSGAAIQSRVHLYPDVLVMQALRIDLKSASARDLQSLDLVHLTFGFVAEADAEGNFCVSAPLFDRYLLQIAAPG